ncbi:tetrahydrofolate dehydrogenase/cyclohydrolase catalytic domain-containing protein [Burkholderia sp. 9120]|uniref:tetrahydrofolate dehydrogenase/cyclohydrolase catalytic domain-containing protein n=1 Tax=Burkholderia sp. 9120 TaxID=1500897 RepID=UPI001E56115F|nr:tetrahydrofolate dehydrogenase/cyclohydrolase catalytic domain-containing protein [Burkholderia sp. 9120]
MSILLDGKAVAALRERELSEHVTSIKARNGGQTAILATILVGDDPSSATYVSMKGKARQHHALAGPLQDRRIWQAGGGRRAQRHSRKADGPMV